MVTEKLFVIFLACLFSCAGLVIFFVWNDGPPAPIWAQSVATLFIIGLASFLIWFSIILLVIRKKIAD